MAGGSAQTDLCRDPLPDDATRPRRVHRPDQGDDLAPPGVRTCFIGHNRWVTGLRFAVLGPLEVRRDGLPIEIGGQRLRALLSLFLLDAGRAIPADVLVSA